MNLCREDGWSPALTLQQCSGLLADEPRRWYAVYTCARHEKAIARQFSDRGVAHFLPLYQAMHRWNKRSVRVSLPLFPGYIFVHTSAQDRFKPLQVPGVLHYVGTATAPSPIADEEVESLQRILVSGNDVVPHPYLSIGKSVRIHYGPLAGLCGVIERTKSGGRFIVSVEMIKRSIAIELNGDAIGSFEPRPAVPLEQCA
jgi:transcription termination/antitermination protein NusG